MELRFRNPVELAFLTFLTLFSRLTSIVDALEANVYHGLLAKLSRRCVEALCGGRLVTSPSAGPEPPSSGLEDDNQPRISVPFCTAVFSFLYHFAGYERGLFCCLSGNVEISVISYTRNRFAEDSRRMGNGGCGN